MSARTIAWALETRPGHPTHKLVLIILADRAHYERITDDSPVATATLAELVAEAGTSTRQIQRALDSLVEFGYLARIHRGKPTGGRDANAYQLLVDGQNHLRRVGGASPRLVAE